MMHLLLGSDPYLAQVTKTLGPVQPDTRTLVTLKHQFIRNAVTEDPRNRRLYKRRDTTTIG